MVKNPPAMQETWIWSLGQEDPLEEGIVTHSSIFSRKIPWTEEPRRLQSMELQRVRHNWMTNTHMCTHTHTLTSVGQMLFVFTSVIKLDPIDKEESDTTEWLHFHFSLSCIGGGNGNPLQCSCLDFCNIDYFNEQFLQDLYKRKKKKNLRNEDGTS